MYPCYHVTMHWMKRTMIIVFYVYLTHFRLPPTKTLVIYLKHLEACLFKRPVDPLSDNSPVPLPVMRCR